MTGPAHAVGELGDDRITAEAPPGKGEIGRRGLVERTEVANLFRAEPLRSTASSRDEVVELPLVGRACGEERR